MLRVTEYREVGRELLREAVGPKIVRKIGFPNAALAYGKESRLIAWGEEPGTVHVAALDQPERRWQWTCELRLPTPLAFSPDGKLLVVAGWQDPKRMEIREVATGRMILQSDNRMTVREYRQTVGFADAGRKLVAANQRGNSFQVVFWDLTQPEQPPTRFVERGTSTGLSISPDGRWVSVSSEDGIAALYDATSLKRRHELAGSMQAVFGVAFSPDSLSLATGAGGRDAIKLWNVETGQELLTLPGTGSLLGDIAFAEDGNTLLLGRIRIQGSWQMWRAPSWEVIATAEAKNTNSSAFDHRLKAEGQVP